MGGSTFNSAEIMRRLHALGTSASTPVLPTTLTNGETTALANSSNQGPAGLATPLQLSTPGAVAPGASTTVSTTAVPIPLSDAEKLRNDFNSQATRLSYGCSVALELFNGHLMMVGSPDGQARVQSLETLQTPRSKGYKDRVIFTLLDLADVRSAGSIRYGDAVWLQLSVGPGDVSWEQGGVLGAKVREAPQLKALGLMDDDAIRNNVQAPLVVGYPIPVTAYLPKSRDEGDLQVDEIQSRLRNKSAKMLGKWIIRSAVSQRRKQKDNFVYNNDEVYLEQDWFYLGADSDAGIAVLRQLPPAVAGKDAKPGAYVVERRGAWKLRLLDSSSGSAGLSLAQQQMERLLLRAKSQLKQSQRMRAGQTKVYGPNLRGGTGFTAQLRAQVAASTRQTESRYAERQEWRLKRIDRHMSEKAQSMNIDLGYNETTTRSDPRTSGRRPNSGKSDAGRDKNSGRRASVRNDQSHRRSSTDPVEATSRRRSSVSFPSPEDEVAKSPSSEVAITQQPVLMTLEAPANVSSCALCHSSSIGYNLCCQLRDVIQLLEQEQVGDAGTMEDMMQSCRDVAPATRRVLQSRAGRSARAENAAVATAGLASVFLHEGLESRNSTSAKETTRHGADAVDTAASTSESSYGRALNERVLQLFAKEDAAMLGIIKYKEKEAYRALAAETHARIGMSPVAAHFRDRFKHVGLFMQMHKKHQEAQQDGIGGHYQKLHADLYSAGKERKRDAGEDDDSEDDPDDYSDSEDSADGHATEHQSVTRLPEPVDGSEGKSADDTERLFPTAEELELLTPVDTKAALALYVQNRSAMAEMMDGYAELVDSQMVAALQAALSTRNRGALVETLDFIARASEFVCARRVQVFVARLLHAVAASDIGDFVSFQKEFDELLVEMQGAASFIRFFRQQRASRRKNKGK